MSDEQGSERTRLHLLSDIIFWGERIEQHLAGVDEAAFEETPVLCDAVCWCVSCLGEAAGQIRQRWPELATDNANLELAKAYAMRNRIAHGYFELDVHIVWYAATVSVPRMIEAAKEALGPS